MCYYSCLPLKYKLHEGKELFSPAVSPKSLQPIEQFLTPSDTPKKKKIVK